MVDAWQSALDNWDTWGVFVVLSAVNLLVLLERTRAGAWLRPAMLRVLRAASLRGRVNWTDWRPLLGVATIWFGGFTIYNYLSGHYGCLPNGLLSDPLGELDSGRAFWQGANPFSGVPYCGTTLSVPYGLAAVLLDAVGALGGIGGILIVWGVLALSIVPLTWAVGGDDRSYLTVYVATSILFVPLITSEFSGATNAIVPVAFLLTLYLFKRRELGASALGGFLATARFPSVFPVLASTGSFARHRVGGLVAGAAVFGGVTALSYLAWGPSFVQSVFINQATRRNYSLNFYGVLLLHNALPATVPVTATLAALTIGLLGAVWFLVRSPVAALAISVVGVALLTPFLAYNFLIWLLPVALTGARARWWLWGIACVGSVNVNLGLGVWAAGGLLWPAEVMDLLLTGFLIVMFVDLWQEAPRRGGPPSGRSATSTSTSGVGPNA